MRTRAYYALALAAAAAATAGGIHLLLRVESSRVIEARMEYLSVVTDLAAESISHFHQERLHDLVIYSTNLPGAAAYAGGIGGDRGKGRLLARVFKPLMESGAVAQVALFDRRGRLALSIPQDVPPPKPSAGPLETARFLGLRPGPGGESFLDYEGPVPDGSRLLLRVRRDAALSPLLNVWPGTEKTARTTIYQRTGDALLVLNDFRGRRFIDPPRRIGLDSDLLGARAARGERGPLLGRDHRGVPSYAVFRRLEPYGWVVMTKMDEKEVLAPMREKTRLLSLAAFGIAALIGASLFVFFRAHADRMVAEADVERRLLSTAIEQAGESVVITDKEGRILYTNPAFTRASGYGRDEIRGANSSVLKSGRHDKAFYSAMWQSLARGEVWSGRLVNRRKDGTLFEEDATITPVRDETGGIRNYIAVKRDVSAVRSLEDQLFHSQKMEAIGRLAGGVAHDFNNILTTINGYAEMLADAASPESQSSADLAEILGAGRRAAMLTRQLLTFSRRAPADPVVGDLRVPVRAMEKMLRRTLGEDIRLVLELPSEPLWVRADPGQVDQILMNLAVNARDAIAGAGKLSVRLREAALPADETRTLEVVPAGRYAVLVVEDDGGGMDASVLTRIFEPFFTTKEKGKGTGLGLSTVFGIVKQNQGFVSVDSALGEGSTFTVHLPLVAAPAGEPSAEAEHAAASVRGDETVLVVEDQGEVLRMVSRVLTAQGYQVIACGGVDRALETAKAAAGPIHLLLTDVVMPGMDGDELADAVLRIRSDVRVLFMSGYTDGRLDRLRESGAKVDLLLKPFTAEQLCRRVRDALDGAAPRGS